MSTRRRIGRGTLAIAVIVLASGGSIFGGGSDAGALKLSKVRVKSVPINQTVGNAMALQATVSGTPAPTGTVEFFEGATSLGTGAVTARVATLSYLFDAGAHTVTAQYLGDAVFAGSTSIPITFLVGDPSNTKVVLQLHSVPATPMATWTATTHLLFVGNVGIAAYQTNYGPRTGDATVVVDGTTSYTVPIAKNRIILDLPDGLGQGPHSAGATYRGDIHYNPNTSTRRRFTITLP